MTGTSLDGLDVALAEINGHGLGMRARLVASSSQPLAEVGVSLRRMATQQEMNAGEIASVSLAFSELHARALAEVAGSQRLDLVAVHGQTVFHAPPLSWQLLNPWPIVHALKAPVVFDLRGGDLAAGGQGAPITPLADWVLFRNASVCRAIVNLGGFCNVTVLPPGQPDLVRGFDVCVCNQLLDALARSSLKADFDEGGAFAMSGRVVPDLLNTLGEWLSLQAESGRSLGTGDELITRIVPFKNLPGVTSADIARTTAAAIAATIARRLPTAARVVLAGGGVHNGALRRELELRIPGPVVTTADLGIAIGMREAMCMAILGALCQDGVPITLPAVTGARLPPLSGCWVYPDSSHR